MVSFALSYLRIADVITVHSFLMGWVKDYSPFKIQALQGFIAHIIKRIRTAIGSCLDTDNHCAN